MTGLIQKVPSAIVLGAPAIVFLLTCRKHETARARLWVWGWVLVLLHFGVRLAEEGFSVVPPLCTAIDTLFMFFGGIAFAVSPTAIAESRHERARLFFLLGTPAVLISFGAGIGAPLAWVSSAATVALVAGAITGSLRQGWKSSFALLTYAGLCASGAWAIGQSLHGNLMAPFDLGVAWLLLYAGVLNARYCRRWSAGVVLSTMAFLGWSAIWTFAAFSTSLPHRISEFNEFWNVPKYLLTFGMILILLEDEQLATQKTVERERALTNQLQSFAEVTSRLLGGADVRGLCNQICNIITSVTTFQRAIVLLADEQHHLYIAGYSGLSDEAVSSWSESLAHLTSSSMAMLASRGRKIGGISFVASNEEIGTGKSSSSKESRSTNPFWSNEDKLLVPIRSPRGVYAGCIMLDLPRELARINSLELSKLELLAEDLGIAIDRVYLQRELIRSEKLASIGQLVGGMAHELNNPLTAVLGYSEMMSEVTSDDQVRREAAIIHREGTRIKRIIENLVRFSKQEKGSSQLVSINGSLDEVLRLWGYQANSRGIELKIDIEPDLPMIRFDEGHLKQVLLNVLTNAFDAVESANTKRVDVSAVLQHGIVSITIGDSGGGFSEPDRVFDPFFTTKGVGKGTGLGLSVCYGIMKQHGADIRAYNRKTGGAGITMEFPVAQQELALTPSGN